MTNDGFDRRDFLKAAVAGVAASASHLAVAQVDSRPGAPELRFRQVNLDFHTSEHIQGIGSRFDAEEFADVVERAHINSITCFGRCHHGWIYYDTKQFPERRQALRFETRGGRMEFTVPRVDGHQMVALSFA